LRILHVTWIFEKVAPENLVISPERRSNQGFMTPIILRETTRKRKKKMGREQRRKKGLAGEKKPLAVHRNCAPQPKSIVFKNPGRCLSDQMRINTI